MKDRLTLPMAHQEIREHRDRVEEAEKALDGSSEKILALAEVRQSAARECLAGVGRLLRSEARLLQHFVLEQRRLALAEQEASDSELREQLRDKTGDLVQELPKVLDLFMDKLHEAVEILERDD